MCLINSNEPVVLIWSRLLTGIGHQGQPSRGKHGVGRGNRPRVLLSGNAPVHRAGRKALNYLSFGMYKVPWNVLLGMSAPFLHVIFLPGDAKLWLIWLYAPLQLQFSMDVSPDGCPQVLPGTI